MNERFNAAIDEFPYLQFFPARCARCGSNWSGKIFDTDTCPSCRLRFEWLLAEPAPGQKFDRQSFGRYLEAELSCPRCGSITGTDHGSAADPCPDAWHEAKSARSWLNRFLNFQLPWPLYVVVGLLVIPEFFLVLWIVLKLQLV